MVILLANPVFCDDTTMEPDNDTDTEVVDDADDDSNATDGEVNQTNTTNTTANESVNDSSDVSTTTTTEGPPPEVVSDCSIQAFHLPEGMAWENCSSASDLAHGSACALTCTTGYTLMGDGLLHCDNGTLLNETSCGPSPCDTTGHMPQGGGPGDCPAMLASGLACTPGCPFGFTPNSTHDGGKMTCEFGVLTEIECVEMPPLECPPGQHQTNYTECQDCPSGKYKVGLGPGPCISCPPGAVTLGLGEDKADACICDGSMYPNRSSTNDLLACEACPNNSRIESGWNLYASVNDCKCSEGYVRVPDSPGDLLFCRLPYACEARAWLVESNLTVLTSSKPHMLKLGKCADYVNNTEGLMPHGSNCRLFCASERAPQLATNWMSAASTDLHCEDGVITGPQPGTWCSADSFEIPPLIFLATVTLAGLVAGLRMEMKQNQFEKSCVKEMQLRLPAAAERVSRRHVPNPAKIKEA